MKNSKTSVYKRQQAILQQLNDKLTIQNDELAVKLGVSNLTIRRDLHGLAERGLVRLIRGGANLVSGALQEDPSLLAKSGSSLSNIEAIARRAAELVNNGDTILINSSKTAVRMLNYIIGKRVIVVTNNGLALNMNLDPLIELIFTGGEVHSNKMSMVGEIAVHNLSRITASKAFFGVSGISARGGITTSILQETAINELMIRRAGQCIVLADGSKVGQQNNFLISSADLISTLITDRTANSDAVFQLNEIGIKIEQVK